MKPFPYYELFFALAAYVQILTFGFFAKLRPAVFTYRTRASLAQLIAFVLGSAFSVFAGGLFFGALQGLPNGIVFYGGLIGFLVFAALYSHVTRRPLLEILNRIAPGLALAHAVGRVGCFLDGCCYGTECGLPWAVRNAAAFERVHPVQLYESAALIFLGVVLWRHETARLTGEARNPTIGLYLVTYSPIRFGLEFLRGDTTRGYWGVLSTSQWISILFASVGAATIYFATSRQVKVAR